jgi:hypothetical protein
MNLAWQAAPTVRRWKRAGSLACCSVLLGLALGGLQAAAQVQPLSLGEMPIPLMFPTALDRPMQPGRPFIGLLRYDEDWGFLKDPANRTEFWDPLKYISLNKAGWYLSLGGETRQRYEIYHNFPFDPRAPSDDNGYYLMRYMLHGDLHLGQAVRVFAQFKSAVELDKDALFSGADRDDLDINQLFIDTKIPLGERDNSVTLRAGRQEFHYGMGRLLTIREGPNNRQGWDGLRGILRWGNWRIDGFYALHVKDELHVFDDLPRGDEMIWGVYATTMLDFFPGLGMDVYYMGDAPRESFFRQEKMGYFQDIVQGIGDEVRHSIGVRFFGGRGRLDWDLEYILQVGEHKGSSILAYSLSTGGGYTIPELPASPRFTFGLDFSSGDYNDRDGTLQTFRPIVFRGNYSGEAAFLQLSNIIKAHPGVDLHLRRDMFLYLDFPLFWRMSSHDGLYSPGGFLVAGPIPSNRLSFIDPQGNLIVLPQINDLYVGWQPSFQYIWQITQYLMFSVSYAHFVSGGFLDKAGRGDADFGAAWFTYKF